MIKTKKIKIGILLLLGFVFLSLVENHGDVKNNSAVIETTEGDECLTTNVIELSEDWTLLLDDTLSNWEKWLGVVHTSVDLPGYPKSDDVTRGTPIGLNDDPKNVYTVIEEGGEKLLKVTGEIYGGLTTKQEYGNYHFSLQFKWGQKKWEPRLNRKRDSGILYNCKGPHGAFWNTWKASLEFQVQESDCGDFISLAGVKGRIPARKDNNTYRFEPRRTPVDKGFVLKSVDHEKPNGQWNTLEVFSIGDRSIHLVNGFLVNAIQDTRFNNVSVTKGQIQIQSEGAEMYYKDIKIKSATDFPEVHLNTLGWDPQDGGDVNELIGQVVALKKSGGDSKWVTTNETTNDNQLIASETLIADAAHFLVEQHPQGGIALKLASNSKYLQVQGNDVNKAVRAFGNAPGTWEQFSWKSKGEGKVALRSSFTGKWIQALWSTDNAPLLPVGETDQDWETFEFRIIDPTTLSIPEINQSDIIKITAFPNPSENILTITGIPQEYKMKMVDMSGKQLILKETMRNATERQLDISGLPKGMYLITLDKNRITFIKE